MTRPSRPRNAPPIRILHLHADGAAARRSLQLINAFGQSCQHAIVLPHPEAMSAIDRGIVAGLAVDYPVLSGRPTPGRLQRLARAMIGNDLVLSYGYGAMAAVMAHTIFGGSLPLPPLVHHEDEAGALTWSRNWYRRIALGRAAALVVPSPQLEAIAVDIWHQPRGRVKYIAPGIRTAAYAARPSRDALPRVIKRSDELWLGTCADETSTQGLIGLVGAFATLPEPWQLVILGDGRPKDEIRNEALRLELGHRVHLPGGVAERARVMGLFDLFALAADRELPSLALIEAMAAGLAVVARDVGDAATTLAPENRAFIVPSGDAGALAAALRSLAEAPALRASVGAANRALAQANHGEAAMVSAYRAVYGAALGRGGFQPFQEHNTNGL